MPRKAPAGYEFPSVRDARIARLSRRDLSHLNGFTCGDISEQTRQELRVKVPIVNPNTPYSPPDDGNFMTKRLPSLD